MKELEEKILKEGKVLQGDILKVNGFLNHLVDVPFLTEMAKTVADRYKNKGITKILTVEASGIAFATCIGVCMNLPVIFAKKHKSANISDNLLTAEVYSYTHKVDNYIVIERDFIKDDDVCLIADDFLASGSAAFGLEKIASDGGAKIAGFAFAIEKGFQEGGKILRDKGYEVCSLAIIDDMTPENGIKFRAQ